MTKSLFICSLLKSQCNYFKGINRIIIWALLLPTILLIACSDQKPQRLYRIYDGKAYGFIDTSGKIIIKPKLTYTTLTFQDNKAIIIDTSNWLFKDYAFIDSNGDTSVKSYPYVLNSLPIDLYPILKSKGQSYGQLVSFIANEFSFSNGLALIYDNKTSRFGYMDNTGKAVIAPQFLNATRFKNGYAVVQTSLDTSNWENTHLGIIDSTGKVIIESKYYNLTRFSHNLSIGTFVSRKQSSSKEAGYSFTSVLLNKKGDVINTVAPGFICCFGEYTGCYIPGYNGILASFGSSPYFIVDSVGNLLKNNRGQDIYYDDVIINQGKWFWGKRLGKYAWFTLGKNSNIEMIDYKPYDGVKSGFNAEGIACVRFPDAYDYAAYGYIDTLGNVLIPAKYYDASDFRGPLARATLKSGSIKIEGYINKKGAFVWSREIRDTN